MGNEYYGDQYYSPHTRHGLGVVAVDRVIYAIYRRSHARREPDGIVEYWTLP